jgi:chromosome segregation ATPase
LLRRNLSDALARERASKQREAALKLDGQAVMDEVAALQTESEAARAALSDCEAEASRLRGELETLRSHRKTLENELTRTKEGHEALREKTKQALLVAERRGLEAQQALSRTEEAERAANEARAIAESRVAHLEAAKAASEAALQGERKKASDLELQVRKACSICTRSKRHTFRDSTRAGWGGGMGQLRGKAICTGPQKDLQRKGGCYVQTDNDMMSFRAE